MKVIVCGDRHWWDRSTIRRILENLRNPDVVVHGGCRGADLIAGEVAEEMGLEVVVHKADWKKHGKAAGPIRNQEMLDAHPDAGTLIAFHGKIHESKGTKDMLFRASKAGRKVYLISG